MKKIAYIVLCSFLLYTSANAEWKMLDTKKGLFIYESDKGLFLKYNDKNLSKNYFEIVPLKTDIYHTSGYDIVKTFKE